MIMGPSNKCRRTLLVESENGKYSMEKYNISYIGNFKKLDFSFALSIFESLTSTLT
jgi:hypothetical protein